LLRAAIPSGRHCESDAHAAVTYQRRRRRQGKTEAAPVPSRNAQAVGILEPRRLHAGDTESHGGRVVNEKNGPVPRKPAHGPRHCR
jgi:hypothetical protein